MKQVHIHIKQYQKTNYVAVQHVTGKQLAVRRQLAALLLWWRPARQCMLHILPLYIAQVWSEQYTAHPRWMTMGDTYPVGAEHVLQHSSQLAAHKHFNNVIAHMAMWAMATATAAQSVG
jgi:hypothetical protein